MAASAGTRLFFMRSCVGSGRVVATVGGVAAASAFGLPFGKLQAKEETPRFTMEASFYDQSSFSGRLMTILDKIDPRTLLISDVEVKRCQALIEEYKKLNSIPTGKTDEDMWQARRTVEAVIHPVTNEPMFAPGRMSAFVPMNAPIAAIMLNVSTPAGTVFSQVLNQTYNVMNNYVNRSSLEVEWAELMKPYGLAVTVSCSIALGAKKLLQVVPALAKLGLIVPYIAVISAGSCNVAFTRMDEWCGRGICIFSEEGKELGMSVKAGQQAVFTTIATRSVCLPMPVLLVPPVVMSMLPLTGAAAMVAEGSLILGCISFALPCCLAILPQEMVISTDALEDQYRNLTDSQGRPITKVVANKGL